MTTHTIAVNIHQPQQSCPLTQISYYTPDQQINRTGLIAWGVILIVIGSLAGLLGLLTIASTIFFSTLPSQTQHPQLSAMILGAGFYLAVAAVLIWLGIGSCHTRRWVRPIIIVATLLCIASGILGILFMILQALKGGFSFVPTTPGPGAAALPPAGFAHAVLIGQIVGIIFSSLAMIALPAAVLYFYAKSSTREKLAALDPEPNWTDRLPIPALGWAMGCLLLGLMNLGSMFNGFALFFTHVLTGPSADIVLSLTGLPLLLGAWLCYTNPQLGWRLTFSITTYLALSSLAFAIHGDFTKVQEIMSAKFTAYGLRQTAGPDYMSASFRSAGAIYYSAALAYALYVRPYFTQK